MPCLVLVGSGCGEGSGAASIDTSSTDGSTTASSSTGAEALTTSEASTGTTGSEASTGAAEESGSVGGGDPPWCRSEDDCIALDPQRPVCDVDTGTCLPCAPKDVCVGGACPGPDGCPGAEPIAVVVGYGARRVMSTDGVTWEHFTELDPNGKDDDNLLRGIGYGDGVFVAVGGGGQGLSYTSRDGIAWKNERRDLRAFLSDVVWFDGLFVAAGGNGFRVRSSDHGATWTDDPGYFSGHFRGIAAGSDRVVAVGHSGTQGMSSTTMDGASWSTPEIGGAPLWAVAFGNDRFVAVGNGGRAAVSDDGVSWTNTDLGADDLRSVVFVDGSFYVAIDGTYRVSSDGETWATMPGAARKLAGAFQGRFVSLGWPATISVSEDLQTWQTVFSPGGSGFTRLAVGAPSR